MLDSKKDIIINKEWQDFLKDFFETQTWEKLSHFIKNEYLNKKRQIFPKPQEIFKAFNLTPVSCVKVVILGQDPYHNDNQAHGLAFSVPYETEIPPSLQNIYKEIESDLGLKKNFKNGNLENWAKQGVLLLNAILSVVAHQPASHRGIGWEEFTNYIIQRLSDKGQNIVFILWGNYAKSKRTLIDSKRHLILESVHPSPLSAHRGFFGSKPFSKTNKYLKKYNKQIIDW